MQRRSRISLVFRRRNETKLSRAEIPWTCQTVISLGQVDEQCREKRYLILFNSPQRYVPKNHRKH